MFSLFKYMPNLQTIIYRSDCDSFRKPWNNYRCCARKAERGEECKQKYFHEHFLQDDDHGFLNDAYVTLIDKTQASDLTKREYFWERTLKTR